MRLLLALGISVVLHAGVALVTWVRKAPPVPPPPAPQVATRIALFELAPTPPPLPQRGEGRGEGRRERAAVRPAAEPEAQTQVEEAEATDDSSPVAPTAPLTPALSPQGERGRVFDVTALHAALAESARRCYPAAARRYGLTGEAAVDFCLDATGALASTKLASSSGQSLLDVAARECVISGALPMPSEAAGGCYTVPVRFGR